MATQQELEALQRIYLAARDNVLDKIVNTGGAGTKTYYNSILKQLEKELKQLQAATNSFINLAIPAAYAKGLEDVYSYFTKNNLMMKAPDIFANIHVEAVYELAREMQFQMNKGITQATNRVVGQVIDSRSEVLRLTTLETAAEKLAGGTTINDMRKSLVKKLKDQGFMSVQYGSGPDAYQVPLDSYATLCARTIPQQAGNLARENQLITNGHDLVELTTHYPTCAVCASLQGRVYSISGNDKRFPPLSRAFSGGYHSIHPQCTHTAVPFIESLQTDEEMQQAVERSNKPFVDNRSTKEVAEYNKTQKASRQARQDLYQYERYKQLMGKDAPASFRSFKALKKAGGEKWAGLESRFRSLNAGSGKVTAITDKAIDSVAKVEVHGLTDAQNTILQTKHKELLLSARADNENNEMSMILSRDLHTLSVDYGNNEITDLNSTEAHNALSRQSGLFVMHNHPNNGGISMQDIRFFLSNDTVQHISAVGNNGSVKLLTKIKGYDRMKGIQGLQRAAKKHVKTKTDAEYNKAVSDYLKHSHEHGVIYKETE